MATAILNGTLVDDGGLVCECRFEYGLTPAYGSFTAWQGGMRTGDIFQALVHNLPGGATVYFRAAARNALGTTYGAQMRFTTIPTLPIVLTVAATNVYTGGARLNGLIVQDQGAPCRVQFEYGGTPSYGAKTPWVSGFVTGNTFFFDIVGLSPGQGYHFRAVAENRYGKGYGQNMSFGTLSDRGAMTGISMELLLLLREEK